MVRMHIEPALGGKRLDRLTALDVRRFVNRLASEEGVGQRTVQATHSVLRNALNRAVSEGLPSRNVAQVVKVTAPAKPRIRPWAVEEARTFLAKATDDSLYAAYLLVLMLGLRRGEALGVGWDDLDLERGEPYLRWPLVRVRGQLVRRWVKTDGSVSTIPLPQPVVNALKVRRAKQSGDRTAAGERWQDATLVFTTRVFTTRYGTPIEPRNFNRSFENRCAKAGVRRIRLHDTRHTCASPPRALGVDLRVIMEILRHSQIAVTANVYTHATTEAQREAVTLLGKALTEAGG